MLRGCSEPEAVIQAQWRKYARPSGFRRLSQPCVLVRSDSVLLGFFGELPRHVRRSFWFRVDRRIYPFFGRKLHRSAGRRRWRSSIEKWPCEKLELHRQKFGSFEPCASRARVEFMLARTNFGRV